MKHYSDEELRLAHHSTALTQRDIEQATLMGCFCCCKVFAPKQVSGYIEGPDHKWAHCPQCGIDSVITDKGTGSVDLDLLVALQKKYF